MQKDGLRNVNRTAQLTISPPHIFQDTYCGVRRLTILPFSYSKLLDGGNDLMFLPQQGSSLDV